MIIGCPTEIKNQEYRVGITPAAAAEATLRGHKVLIQSGAGNGSGFTNEEYLEVGAIIIDTAEELFKKSEMIVKVKEPQAIERAMLREDQILFTYLHLAPDLEQTNDLLKSGVTAIAYETVTDRNGGLPLLAPMSEVAGKLAPQVGSWALQKANGGLGTLLGGVPGVSPSNVIVIGGGNVGVHAARVAAGMGANVTILDKGEKLHDYDAIILYMGISYEGTLNLFGGLGDDFCKKMIQLESFPGKLLSLQHEMPDLVDMVSKRLKNSSTSPYAKIIDLEELGYNVIYKGQKSRQTDGS